MLDSAQAGQDELFHLNRDTETDCIQLVETTALCHLRNSIHLAFTDRLVQMTGRYRLKPGISISSVESQRRESR